MTADIDVESEDVVIYDAEGYAPLRDFLKASGIRHVLLTGYATDMLLPNHRRLRKPCQRLQRVSRRRRHTEPPFHANVALDTPPTPRSRLHPSTS